ncbi:MAG: sigma-54-dependent Fis family transcriptional regulator [Peptococcaceae bacterium]|jgi:transcriptional regulator of acetoin/glycerol metabolism|nr:sigma-54-dependent Fis family transcriptional regulator [Peptococcaceae bacterium]MDH7524675.1 sigma-54-dependent Fis family transcriptional regulator [Peptococcaceae bacterium]
MAFNQVPFFNSIRSAWDAFVTYGEPPSHTVRPEIIDSWLRCRQAGVDPENGCCSRILSSTELKEILLKNWDLIHIAKPFMNRLYKYFQGSGFIVVLVDKDGYIMESFGDPKALESAKEINFIRGARWLENEVGTNAIGTALVLKKPIQVTGPEHYCRKHHTWTCSAAPIFDLNNQVAGVLDISGSADETHLHTLGMAVAAVEAITRQLRIEQDRKQGLTGGLNNRAGGELAAAGNSESQARVFSGGNKLYKFSDIICSSPALKESVHVASLAAGCMSNVLLQGESGTGKELFAQAIHSASCRKNGPFIAVNCGAIPRELIASELFGYEEGAFTGARKGGKPGKFELARGGTLFLDEIGEMPLEQQVALLRVLQEKKIYRIGSDRAIDVDVRIICATNKNILEEVGKGAFRQDLYYRLNVISITLPSLRERREDIVLLFNHFLKQISRGKEYYVEPEVYEQVERYDWPGNVRELQNTVERLVNLVQGPIISLSHLPPEICGAAGAQLEPAPSLAEQVMGERSSRTERKRRAAEKERQKIVFLLDRYGGNVTWTARELGLSRNTLYRKMRLYGIKN